MFGMIGNIFKNLFSKPATRMFPHEVRTPFAGARGQISGCEIEKCIFCNICAKKCPSDAIVVDKGARSWTLDQYKCIICGVCVEVCPKKCILMDENFKPATADKSLVTCVQAPKPEAPRAEVPKADAASEA